MQLELVTKQDFQDLKNELLDEIRSIFNPGQEKKEWLKSNDVMKLLGCSPGTLQNLRINGTLPFTKMGGTVYYNHADVIKMLNRNKRNAA